MTGRDGTGTENTDSGTARAAEARAGRECAAIAALGAVIASGVLGRSKRQAALLRYLVTEEVAGRGARLSARTIAAEALEWETEEGSKAPDSRRERALRVEISRLRLALERYRADAAPGEPVIDLPKGRFRPVIEHKHPAGTDGDGGAISLALPHRWVAAAVGLLLLAGLGVAAAALWPGADGGDPPGNAAVTGPRIAVVPFENISGTPRGERLAYGMGIEVASLLHAFRWLTVYVDRAPDAAVGGRAARRGRAAADYRLTGAIHLDGGRFSARIGLTPPGADSPIWTRVYTGSATVPNLMDVQASVAEQIALEVGGRDHAVAMLEEARLARDDERPLNAYACVLDLYAYWRRFAEAEHADVRDCLEAAVQRQPDYADAWAGLAFAYIDEARYGYNPRAFYDPLARARTAAQRGWDQDPDRVLPAMALYTVHSLARNQAEFLRVGRLALRAAPSDPDLLADFGNKAALTFGLWDQGMPRVTEALARNPKPPFWYFITPAFDAYRRDQPAAALDWSERMNAPAFPPYHLVRLAAFARLEDWDGVARQRTALGGLGVTDVDGALARLRAMGYDAALQERLVADLTRAFARTPRGSRPPLPRLHVMLDGGGPSAGARAVSTLALDVLSRFDPVAAVDARAGGPPADPWPEDYGLALSVARGKTLTRVRARLTHLASGAVVETRALDLPLAQGAAIEGAAREALQTAIAGFVQRAGPLIVDYAARGTPSAVMRCVLAAHAYFRAQSDAAHAEASGCARETLETAPRAAELFAVLSLMNREAHTDGRPTPHDDPLAAALADAERAAAFAADGAAMPAFLRAGVLSLMGDVEGMVAAGEAAIARNPFDASIQGGVGAYLAFAGRHQAAIRHLERAQALSPEAGPWRDHALFLGTLATGRLDAARAAAERLADAGADTPLALAARLIATAHGSREDPKTLRTALQAAVPTIHQDPAQLYRPRAMDPGLIDLLVRELRAMGI